MAGLQQDLGLTEKQYKICVTILYVPYILAEIPSNLILKFVGPRWLLPTILTLWGMITCLQGIVHHILAHLQPMLTSTGLVTNFSGLLAVRFFLGMLEGPMLPGIVLYLSGFYTRSELGLRYTVTASKEL